MKRYGESGYHGDNLWCGETGDAKESEFRKIPTRIGEAFGLGKQDGDGDFSGVVPGGDKKAEKKAEEKAESPAPAAPAADAAKKDDKKKKKK